MDELVQKINQAFNDDFMTIAVAGPVSVGKSTFANKLASALTQQVTVISTDDFLMPNSMLMTKNLFNQKGFPQTYDLEKLEQVMTRFKSGELSVQIPCYTQELADIHPKKKQTIKKPEILIIEGVVALQLQQTDFKIYLDASLIDIKAWYLTRTLAMTALSKNDPKSWRYQYTRMPIVEFSNLVMKIWDETNQVNLDRYILPSKQRADALVMFDENHDIKQVTIK
ncbi:type I pantothenate kinase [Leuconostoc gasicomitatum]|uniref:type I pantothenate kinase n=1 Tax=Leuconostoc gasicomitatum TaxID=115778 RepID=UPI000744B225|nr:type I pantothenate kinase [Leuconostoc gasicomitatum]MBZ5952522.1 type I pantothenate kinase [Leuconostoc gasicomitatum]MBZ5954871.1 type I pantothenate kinase [Leuconostoc gasicomitatum]MBZ5988677.1 type I pantothenate kinase [Leuconostoc gasicomitatum]MBZ5989242.1 type I pantothenate kinase [Leuconostoc gasicomitatum]CUR64394.1 Pantothenate kinase [Leuconostoc gasicomitatum KG16-1]